MTSAPQSSPRPAGFHAAALASRPLTSAQCRLVEKHYPQVRAVVAQLRHSLPAYADLDELQSVGLTGLIAAVRRFNAAQSKTFEAYVAVRIRGAILDELRRLDWMPRSARHQARQMRSVVGALEQRLGRAPTTEETRAQFGLDPQEFSRLQQRTRPVRFIPLDQPVERGSGRQASLHESLPDEDAPVTAERLETREAVAALLDKIHLLPERHRKVVTHYYFEELRLAEIAQIFGVTEARICQIHTQALQLLRQMLCAERN